MSKSRHKFSYLEENGAYRIPKVPKELKPAINWTELLIGGILIGCLAVVSLFCLLSGYFLLLKTLYLMIWLLIVILIFIPQTWILCIITKRTKSIVFTKDLFINSLIFILLSFGTLGILFAWGEGYEYPSLIWILFLSQMSTTCCLFLIVLKHKFLNKPLFWDHSIKISQAPIISIHSIEIDEELDGYSQRPISSDFQALENLIPSPSDFKNKLENYCIFLGKKGELIDWHIKESFALIYPRFLTRTPVLLKPLFLYQLLKRLRTKEDITSIEISLSPPQISINIAFQDYNVLNREPTFHTLCLYVLKSFKVSLIAFLNNDLDTAYHELTRGKESAFKQTVIIFNIFSWLASLFRFKKKEKRIERSNKERIIDEQRNE